MYHTCLRFLVTFPVSLLSLCSCAGLPRPDPVGYYNNQRLFGPVIEVKRAIPVPVVPVEAESPLTPATPKPKVDQQQPPPRPLVGRWA